MGRLFSITTYVIIAFFFLFDELGGHCLKKITVEQFILTRQIICQDQRLSVRKKKKTPRPHLQSVITPGGLSGYPKMLCRRCRSGFLTLSFLCVRLCLCVCVCVSSYLHCEWATEQQLVKDKRIQQKIKRFKMKQAQRALLFADVRPCGCVSLSVCRHYVYTRHIWLLNMSRCACLTGKACVCVCVSCVYLDVVCVCAWMFN